MIPRRSPGQRRRRTRRGDELAQLEATDPLKHQELLELRHYNPQAYRKELMKLVRKGVIQRGRAFEIPDELQGVLSLPISEILTTLDAGIERGDYNFRALGGLLQAEKSSLRRPEVIEQLERRLEEHLAAEGRALR